VGLVNKSYILQTVFQQECKLALFSL